MSFLKHHGADTFAWVLGLDGVFSVLIYALPWRIEIDLTIGAREGDQNVGIETAI